MRVRISVAAPVFGACLIVGAAARAEPIIVTAAWEMTRMGGSVSLDGPDGFHFGSGLRAENGPYALALCVRCLPGTAIGIGGEWSGQDLSGEVTYDDRTFSVTGTSMSGGYGGVTFLGGVVVPPLEGTSATVLVPFTLAGFFVTPERFRTGVGETGTFEGSGTATITFVRPATNPYWSFSALSAGAAPAPTVSAGIAPEPNLVVLLGAGIAAAWRRRALRRA